MTWTARPYQPGDEAGILKLRRAVFGDVDPVRLDVKTWRWQFLENPAGQGWMLLAEDGGRIVGQYAAIPTRLLIDGQERICGYSCDTMVHPGHQRKGMFTGLAAVLYRDMEERFGVGTVWGFPNERSMPGFIRNLGWEPAGPFLVWAALPKASAFIRPKAPLTGELDCGGGLAAKPVNRFGPEHDALWMRCAPASGVIQVRDSQYLNWRYMGVKQFGYYAFNVYQDGGLQGWFVLRTQTLARVRTAVLADVFPLPILDDSATRRLIAAIRRLAARTGHASLAALFPRGEETLARRCRFVKIPAHAAPKVFHLAGRFEKDVQETMTRPRSWRISLGDTDVV